MREFSIAASVFLFANAACATDLNDLNVGDKVEGSAAPASMYTCAGGRVALAIAIDTQNNRIEIINVTDMKHPIRQTRSLNVFHGVIDTFKAYDGQSHKYVKVTNASGDGITFYTKPNYGYSVLRTTDPEGFSSSSAFHQLLVENDPYTHDKSMKISDYECYPSLHVWHTDHN
jgi:hypothetical protein